MFPPHPAERKETISVLRLNFSENAIAALYVVAALGIAVLALVLGQREFAGYDCSMLIDSGWRMHLHQRPYIDFPNMLPPGFLLSTWAAISLFGPHWYAFTLTQTLLFLAFATAAYWTVHRIAKHEPSDIRCGILFGFLVAVAIPQMATVHLWHSTEASFCATYLLLWFGLTARDLVRAQHQSGTMTGYWGYRSAVVLAAFVSAFLWLSKPNLALAGQLSLLLFAVFRRRLLSYWFAVSAGGLLLALLVLRLARIRLFDVVNGYAHVTGRPTPMQILSMYAGPDVAKRIKLDFFASYAFVIAAVLLLLFLWSLRRSSVFTRVGLVTLLPGLLVTVAGMTTDWDMRSDDMAPVYFGVAFAALCLSGAGSRMLRVQKWILACLLCYFVPFGYSAAHRGRMLAAGPWAGIPYGQAIQRYDRFFGDFQGRTLFWNVLDTIDGFHAKEPDQNVFFGPRLEFEYARFGIPSPLHVPIWWHPGTSYSKQDENAIGEAWKQHRFTTVYLAEKPSRLAPLPIALMNDLSHYDLISVPGTMPMVYRRKPGQ